MERTAPVLGEKKVVAALAAAEKTPMCIPREEFAFTETWNCNIDIKIYSIESNKSYTLRYSVHSHNYIGTIWTPYEAGHLNRSKYPHCRQTRNFRCSWFMRRTGQGESWIQFRRGGNWIMPVFIILFRANVSEAFGLQQITELVLKQHTFYLQLFILKKFNNCQVLSGSFL